MITAPSELPPSRGRRHRWAFGHYGGAGLSCLPFGTINMWPSRGLPVWAHRRNRQQ